MKPTLQECHRTTFFYLMRCIYKLRSSFGRVITLGHRMHFPLRGVPFKVCTINCSASFWNSSFNILCIFTRSRNSLRALMISLDFSSFEMNRFSGLNSSSVVRVYKLLFTSPSSNFRLVRKVCLPPCKILLMSS